MSDLAHMTKGDLIAEVGALRAEVARATDSTEKLNAAQKQEAPRRVYEADALQSCIRALDVLLGATDQRGMSSANAAISRVLRFLAAKYGIDLIDVQIRDCARRHIDEVSPYAISNAVEAAIR